MPLIRWIWEAVTKSFCFRNLRASGLFIFCGSIDMAEGIRRQVSLPRTGTAVRFDANVIDGLQNSEGGKILRYKLADATRNGLG